MIHSFRSENDTYAGLTFVISKNFEVTDQHEIEKGRIYQIRCESTLMSDVKYNIVGFYGYPSDYSTAQRNRLISKVKESLKVDETNILMGDFNFVEESIDRSNRKPDCSVTAKDSLVIKEWKAVKNTFDLNDTFRNINPQIRRYSYVAKNKKSKSRIDRIYISGSEAGKVLKQNFKETPWDDHKIVVVELSQSMDRGPGQWALNTDLLTILAPGFFGWCSTRGGGVFHPLYNSFVFKARLLKFCTELLWDKMNIWR